MTSVIYKLHCRMSAVHYYFYARYPTLFANTYGLICCYEKCKPTLMNLQKCIVKRLRNVYWQTHIICAKCTKISLHNAPK